MSSSEKFVISMCTAEDELFIDTSDGETIAVFPFQKVIDDYCDCQSQAVEDLIDIDFEECISIKDSVSLKINTFKQYIQELKVCENKLKEIIEERKNDGNNKT